MRRAGGDSVSKEKGQSPELASCSTVKCHLDGQAGLPGPGAGKGLQGFLSILLRHHFPRQRQGVRGAGAVSLLKAPREVMLHPFCVTPLASGSPEPSQASLPGGEWAALGCGAERGKRQAAPSRSIPPARLASWTHCCQASAFIPPSLKVIRQPSIHHPDAIAQMNAA